MKSEKFTGNVPCIIALPLLLGTLEKIFDLREGRGRHPLCQRAEEEDTGREEAKGGRCGKRAFGYPFEPAG